MRKTLHLTPPRSLPLPLQQLMSCGRSHLFTRCWTLSSAGKPTDSALGGKLSSTKVTAFWRIVGGGGEQQQKNSRAGGGGGVTLPLGGSTLDTLDGVNNQGTLQLFHTCEYDHLPTTRFFSMLDKKFLAMCWQLEQTLCWIVQVFGRGPGDALVSQGGPTPAWRCVYDIYMYAYIDK